MVDWSAVWARRLQRHGLSAPLGGSAGGSLDGPASIAGVVATMCGAHAQVMSAAELSIGLRLSGGAAGGGAGVTRADVRAALWEQRSLVKTRGPRGTVHLLPTVDLPLWTGALSAVPLPPDSFPPDIRMTADQVDAVLDALETALAGAAAGLTVDELTGEVVARAGAWAGDPVMPAFQVRWPRWRQIEGTAVRLGVMCFGPPRGRLVTYTSPARWLPGFAPADPAVALPELVRRYLHAYGPATPAQFARWFGAPPRWAAQVFESMGEDLVAADIEGDTAWFAADDDAVPLAPPEGVRLLPYFDPYQVGCHPRDRLFPGRAAERALAGGQAGNYPVLLIDGLVAGVWHQRRSGRTVDVTVEPLVPLGRHRQRELDEQVQRVAAVLEARPQWTIGTVTVGPHA